MSELSLQKATRKRDWTLTPNALDRLLSWLDEGTNSEGQKYLEMRRRLVSYFDRKNCRTPEDLADETLNRVARRLEEGVTDSNTPPAKYCYIVARFVFMEDLRGMQKTSASLDDMRRESRTNNFTARQIEDETEMKEKRLDCLEECAGKLEPLNREIIFRYYRGKERVKIENRRLLAEELGITLNALSIRACRIRDKLETCVKNCVGAERNVFR